MSKIIIPPMHEYSPHIECELELMEKHQVLGDEIFFLDCNKNLKNCFAFTWTPTEEYCNFCYKRREIGRRLANIKGKHIFFPNIDIGKIPEYHFSDIKELKAYTYESANLGMGVVSELISFFQNEEFDMVENASLVQQKIITSIYFYMAFLKILDDVKPDLVYIFNGRFIMGSAFIKACEEKKIDYYTHERGGVAERYRIVKNDMVHSYAPIRLEAEQLYMEFGSEKAKEAAQIYYDKKRYGQLEANFIYNGEQSKDLLPENFDPGKKNIVLFNSTLLEYAALPSMPNMTGFYPNEKEAILAMAEGILENKNYHFYCRVHPNMTQWDSRQVKDLLSLRNLLPNLTIIPPDSTIDTYALMDKASVVLVFHSTMGAEAAFAGKPVIVLGNAVYRDYGGFYLPKDHREVMEMLWSELDPLDPTGAIKYGLWLQEGGIKFKHYEPKTAFSGLFKNIDIVKFAEWQVLLEREEQRQLLNFTDS